MAVDCQDEPAEIAGIVLVEPGAMLARDVTARIRDEERAALFEDDRGSDRNRSMRSIENRERKRDCAHGENGRLRHEFAHFLSDEYRENEEIGQGVEVSPTL